jgi:hypothetical protein
MRDRGPMVSAFSFFGISRSCVSPLPTGSSPRVSSMKGLCTFSEVTGASDPELVATYKALIDQIMHDCTELRSTGVKMPSPRRRSFVQVQAAIHLNHDGAHS